MIKGVIPKTKDEWYRFFAGAAAGAVEASGITVTAEQGFIKTVLQFNRKIAIVDAAGVGARVALKVLDLPQGLVIISGAVADLKLSAPTPGVIAAWDGDFGVGTAAAAADATLSGTEQNIIPTTATPQAVAGATTAKGVSTAQLIVDGTATAVDVYLNILIDDADQDVTTAPTEMTITGTLSLVWSLVGDK